MSVEKYKEICEDLLENKKIKKIVNNSDDKNINFKLTISDDFEADHKSLQLYSYIHTSNMVLFDVDNKLKRYENVSSIIEEFCETRLIFYTKRKEYIIKQLLEKLSILKNKLRFLKDVMNKKIDMMNTQEEKVIEMLEENNYVKSSLNYENKNL